MARPPSQRATFPPARRPARPGRTACRYRKPRSSYKYMRPEMQQRHSAFKRGSAYLERYCQLIAFASYLEVGTHGWHSRGVGGPRCLRKLPGGGACVVCAWAEGKGGLKGQ